LRNLLLVLLLAASTGATPQAQTEIDALERELQTAKQADRVDLLNRLARATQHNEPAVSIGYAEQALELAERIDDQPGRARALNNLGSGHYYLSQYSWALDAYERSLRVAETLGDDELIAKALNNIGVINYVWGETDRALEN